jgi:hypothetical protein
VLGSHNCAFSGWGHAVTMTANSEPCNSYSAAQVNDGAAIDYDRIATGRVTV